MQRKYINIFFFIIALHCVLCTTVFAQDSSIVKLPVFTHASFYYDFPKSTGASAGIDFVFKRKIKTSFDRDSNQRIRYRDWIINADVGFYRYRFNNTGVFFVPSIGKRYSGKKTRYFELLLGAGVVRTFYDGIVYSVDDNGKVEEKSYFGRWYATASIAGTFGWDLANAKKAKPLAFQLKPVLWFQFPYNSFMLPHLAIEACIKYHFKNLHTNIKPQWLNK